MNTKIYTLYIKFWHFNPFHILTNIFLLTAFLTLKQPMFTYAYLCNNTHKIHFIHRGNKKIYYAFRHAA
jgi:hypothetical protein